MIIISPYTLSADDDNEIYEWLTKTTESQKRRQSEVSVLR